MFSVLQQQQRAVPERTPDSRICHTVQCVRNPDAVCANSHAGRVINKLSRGAVPTSVWLRGVRHLLACALSFQGGFNDWSCWSCNQSTLSLFAWFEYPSADINCTPTPQAAFAPLFRDLHICWAKPGNLRDTVCTIRHSSRRSCSWRTGGIVPRR